MKKALYFLFVVSFLLVGCAALIPSKPQIQMFAWGTNDFSTNGASIFYSGRTLDGEPIPYTGGPIGGMMMNQRLTCAACHGEDGSGGIHLMHMQTMDAPDIRLSALGEETHKGEAAEEHNSNSQEPYDIQLFKLAVVEGKHPNGERLSNEMPRWQLSDKDLEDLFAFIATLD